MNIEKANKRDKKRRKRSGMQEDGRSTRQIAEILARKAQTPRSIKQVTLEYWVDGIRMTRRIPQSNVEEETNRLRWAGASGIKALRGKHGK